MFPFFFCRRLSKKLVLLLQIPVVWGAPHKTSKDPRLLCDLIMSAAIKNSISTSVVCSLYVQNFFLNPGSKVLPVYGKETNWNAVANFTNYQRC